MIDALQKKQIANSLRRLANAHAAMVKEFESALTTVSNHVGLEDHITTKLLGTSRKINGPQERMRDKLPVADPTVFSIVYKGRHCFLGNALTFRFFCRLSEQPNEYVGYDELFRDVWHAKRSRQAVRNVALQLRRKLIHARMRDVADAIDGHTRGHYILWLNRFK